MELRKHLNFNITILMIITLIVLFFITGLIDYRNSQKQNIDLLHDDLEIIPNRLIEALRTPMWNLDTKTINNIVIAEMQNRNIYSIDVYDLITDKTFVSKIRDQDWNVIDSQHGQAIDESFVYKEVTVEFDGKNIGTIGVRLTDKFYKTDIRAEVKKLVIQTIMWLIIFSIVLSFVIRFSVVEPIKLLAESFEKFRYGKFNKKIKLNRKDELNDLASAFNKMGTDLKRSREKLENYSKNLEKQVKKRTSEFEKEKIRAETANRAKSLFLANMSHELRTPITSIMGYSHLMQNDKGLSSNQKKNLKIINRSGNHLLGLINDVLEISKIESGRSSLVKTAFDMSKLVEGLVDMFRYKATEKGIKFNFVGMRSVPKYIVGDEGKIRQILINVLSNAIKFTEKGGITFWVSSKPHKKGKIRMQIEVEDTGPGIAKDEIGKVFKYFEQTESGRKIQKGTGLGLAITRSFLRMMDGGVSVKSKVGKGSVFRFHFDVEKGRKKDTVNKEAIKRVVGLAPEQQVPKILVVEDVKENRGLLVNLFKKIGINVRKAANGKEAIDIFKRWNPELVLMDIRMPVMDGIEAMKRIRETSQGRKAIVIALTAYALEEEKKEVLEAGFDGFVRKPYDENELFDIVGKQFGLKYKYEKGD